MRTPARSLLVGVSLVAALAGPSAAQDPLAAPPPGNAAATGQIASGLVVEVRLTSRTVNIRNIGGSNLAVDVLQGGFFAGYKADRFVFGLGFDLLRQSQGTSSTGQPDSSESQTAILFSPGVQAELLRSADQRVELFGELDLGFGHTFDSTTPPPMMPPDTSNSRIVYTIGPGVRFWAAPQFAIAGLVGLQGDFMSNSSTYSGVTNTLSTGVTTIVSQLQLMGVF